jgi:hypothetical protein
MNQISYFLNNNSASKKITQRSQDFPQWYQDIIESLNLPQLKKRTATIHKLSYANAWFLCYAGARAVALVKLMQSFYKTYNLPILKRKWDNPTLNQYLIDFQTKNPTFSYEVPVFSV